MSEKKRILTICSRGKEMKNIKLKPCPFCGKKTISYLDVLSEFNNMWVVRCNLCNVEMREHGTQDGILKSWNRRTQ